MEDQDYIVFENYLTEALNSEEILSFEARLKNDPEFNSAFNTYKELSGFLEHKFGDETETAAFTATVGSISKDYFKNEAPPKNQRSKTSRFFQMAIAASIALFIGISVFNSFSDPEYGDFNGHEPLSLGVRGSQEAQLIEAESAFNNKEYATAEMAIKTALEADQTNLELHLYLAIAQIELDKYEAADAHLIPISQGNSAFKHRAIWYLALNKLKQEQYLACAELLKQIPESADDYRQAQKLLKEID